MQKVISMQNKRILSIAKRLRNLTGSNFHVSQRDYRLSELRDVMESVIPELVQQQRDPENRTYSQSELEMLAQIMQIGRTFTENGNQLNRVNSKLADIITTLGQVLQGIDI